MTSAQSLSVGLHTASQDIPVPPFIPRHSGTYLTFDISSHADLNLAIICCLGYFKICDDDDDDNDDLCSLCPFTPTVVNIF